MALRKVLKSRAVADERGGKRGKDKRRSGAGSLSGGGSISGASKTGGGGGSWAGEGAAEGGGGGEDDSSSAAAALAALRLEEEESARVQRIMAELSKLGLKQDRTEVNSSQPPSLCFTVTSCCCAIFTFA